MRETGMVLHDVLSEIAETLFEGGIDLGVVLANFLRREGRGFEELKSSALVWCLVGEIHDVEWWFLVGSGVVSLAGVSLSVTSFPGEFWRGSLSITLQITNFLLEKNQRGVGGIFPVKARTRQLLEQLFHLCSGGKSDLNGLGRVLWSCH